MTSTHGVMQRFKGKIKAKLILISANGLVFNAGGSLIQAPNLWSNAGAPTNGTSGTLAGFANPGDLLVDTTNKVLYQNSNTLASPTWTALTTSTGAGTYSGTFDGTIGGTTPADGKFTTIEASGLITEAVATGITAHAGGGQASAVALTKQWNKITVCATSADSVKLPAAVAGLAIGVFNDGAAPAAVFPSTGDTIDGNPANTAVVLTNAKRAVYICFANGAWESAQLGVASA